MYLASIDQSSVVEMRTWDDVEAFWCYHRWAKKIRRRPSMSNHWHPAYKTLVKIRLWRRTR